MAEEAAAEAAPEGDEDDAFEVPRLSQISVTNKSSKTLALIKKQGTYIGGVTEGVASRKEMIEYVSLLRWSADCCLGFPLTLALWLVLVASVSYQANSDGAFRMRQQLERHVESVVAVPTKGVAPATVFNEDPTSSSMCNCSCATKREVLCQDNVTDDPLWDDLVPRGTGTYIDYTGELMPAELQLMRARAAQLKLVANNSKLAEPMGLKQIRGIGDVMFWIQHGLVPDFFHEEGRDVPLDLQGLFAQGVTYGHVDSGLLLRRNQVIGGLRLRQTRFMAGECSGDAGVTATFATEGCLDTYRLQATPFGPGRTSYAEGFLPEGNGYEFNAYFQTRRPLYVSLESIEHLLKVYDWVDAKTNTLTAEALFLNADASPPLFGTVSVEFRAIRSGGVESKIRIRSTFIDAYPSFYPYVFLDFLWLGLVATLLVRQVTQIFKACFSGKDVELVSVFNILDWVTLFLGLCIAIFWLVIVSEMSGATTAVGAFPKVPDAGSDLDTIKAYNDYWSLTMENVVRVLDFKDTHRLLLFWYTLVLTLQFFRVYRGQPKLAQLSYAVLSAFEDLLHFMILFLVIFLNFAFSGFMLYGLHLDNWASPVKAIMSSARALMGHTNLTAMYEVAPLSTLAWFCMFTFILVLVTMNMLLATILDHFQMAKANAGAFTGVTGQLKYYIKDQWRRFRLKDLLQFFCCCFAVCCCKRRPSLKYGDEILDELMTRAGYDKSEQRLVRRSVLGPKFRRKQFDKKMFLGQVSEDCMGANESANDDLIEMELEDEYIEHMVQHAQEFRDKEADPKELTINQMRELVSRAEWDISEMRDRLGECQKKLKISMNSVSNQMLTVEQLVHTQLAEVVLCAASAGVPDKAAPPGGDAFRNTAHSDMSQTATRLFKNLEQTNTTSTFAMKSSTNPTLRKAFGNTKGPAGSMKDVEEWQASLNKLNGHTRSKMFRVGPTY